jgi:hypothetical protein
MKPNDFGAVATAIALPRSYTVIARERATGGLSAPLRENEQACNVRAKDLLVHSHIPRPPNV